MRSSSTSEQDVPQKKFAVTPQARIEAHALLLAEREFAVPDADLPDVLAACDGLAAAVAGEVASLEMMQTAEPFGEVLRRLARPALATKADAGETIPVVSGGCSEHWVTECLARIDSVAPGTLAWHEIDAESALRRARMLDAERAQGRIRGPLHGMPVGIKDMMDRVGRVARWGSPLRNAARPAAADSTVVARLEQAGAVILGTQHMAEFAMSPTGLNAAFGPGRNPWNVEHVSGGSSSGAGMSVGAGHVPLAIGSDTGGSVRLPAALCGVTGLKPTQYRISVAGVMPLSPSLDCVGPVGRSVEHCAWAYAAMAGLDPADASCLAAPVEPVAVGVPAGSLTIAVPRLAAGPLLSPDMLRVFNDAVSTLVAAGVRVVSIDPPDLDLPGRLASVLLATESTAIHRMWLQVQAERYGRQVRRRLSRGLLTTSIDYYDALRLRAPMLRRFLDQALHGADVLLLPATPDVAPRVADTVGPDEALLEKAFSKLSFWTRGINYFGVPALSLPAGVGALGLPLAVQLVGPPLGEDRVFALGHHFQQHTDWHLRRPGSRAPAPLPAR